jgi:hypothetical protein
MPMFKPPGETSIVSPSSPSQISPNEVGGFRKRKYKSRSKSHKRKTRKNKK